MERKYQVILDEEVHRKLKIICAFLGLTMNKGIGKCIDISLIQLKLTTPHLEETISKSGNL